MRFLFALWSRTNRLMQGNPDSEIRENFACKIRNIAQGIRNPTVTVIEPRFTDTRLIRTPRYYGQFSLSQGKALAFSLNSTRLIRTPSVVPSVSVLTGFWLYLWLQFGIQIPRTRTGIQFLESGIHGVQSRIQDCLEFPHMGRNKGEHETRVTGDNARKNIKRERVWLRASTRTRAKIAWLTKCCCLHMRTTKYLPGVWK